jgi:tRNA dimethylallyltransferase
MKFLVVIAGPTASGKTKTAIDLALHFKSEILSADSRQFYRKMNIGTAKPDVEELKKVPHHFIDFLEPGEKYNIGKFETDALEKINLLFQKNDLLFLTGGSGLYIDAICKGIDDLPESVPEIRNELIQLYHSEGLEPLKQKLKEIDPDYYDQVDLNNPQRLIRAIEVVLISGKKFSELRRNSTKQRNFSVVKIGLLVDREFLYNRINQRVDEMIKNGLVREVELLLPYRNENSMMTVGYAEIIEYLDGNCTLNDAIDKIKQNTRNYAKRQMTWFRRDPEIKWFDPSETEKMIQYIVEIFPADLRR